MNDDPFLVDRHDLDALKELMNAKFDGLDNTLQGMQEALRVAAVERARKDQELNEVRQRFVDRINFEQYKEGQNRALNTLVEKINEVQRRMAWYAGGAAVGGFALSTILRLLGVTVGPS